MSENANTPLSALEREIAARLKPLCMDWPEPLFESLVQKCAAIAAKYEHQNTNELLLDPRLTDLMVAELNALADKSAELRQQLSVPTPLTPPPKLEA